MFMHWKGDGECIQPFVPLAEQSPRSSEALCSISASLLGTKDVGIVKVRLVTSCSKCAQAPRKGVGQGGDLFSGLGVGNR